MRRAAKGVVETLNLLAAVWVGLLVGPAPGHPCVVVVSFAAMVRRQTLRAGRCYTHNHAAWPCHVNMYIARADLLAALPDFVLALPHVSRTQEPLARAWGARVTLARIVGCGGGTQLQHPFRPRAGDAVGHGGRSVCNV